MEMLYIYNYINVFEEKSLLSNYFGALAWNLESFQGSKKQLFLKHPLSPLLLVSMYIENICLSQSSC